MKSTSYDGAIDVVTDLREGGDVRGSPLTVIIALGLSLGQHIPCRDIQGGLEVYPLAGVYASHKKSSKESASGRGARSVRGFFHSKETMRDMLESKHGS
jgi:hypothetical protein